MSAMYRYVSRSAPSLTRVTSVRAARAYCPLLPAVGCVSNRRVSSPCEMPKSAQNQPERKTKTVQDVVAGVKSGSGPSGQPELKPDGMPERTCSARSDDENVRVEYLDTPVKSENDKKEYRVIRLQNALTALLISDMHSKECSAQDEDDQDEDESEDESDENSEGDDEDDYEDDDDDDEEGSDSERSEEDAASRTKRVKRDAKKAACGLCVGVGSFSDPKEVPGMAHFLEHMVFMGSEKYPEENDFDAFISKHGGYSNASTDCEHTTFYFDIQEKHLLPALDRFAQFFIKPLMKKDAITREREAVESEFQLATPRDENRREQLFCSFARADHPASKFVWGNLVTLRDNVNEDKLYEELHKFRERHYSAHRMKLAIQARLPLDTLEKYVTTCFADVPNNELVPDDFTSFKGGDSFDTPAFRRIYRVKPVKDCSHLQLTWALPPLLDYYKSKPYRYISWLLGHEGKGSLISYLRKKMWGVEIYSGNPEIGFEHNSMYSLLRLIVNLTDKGYEHLDEVLDAIFSFVNMVKREGPQKRIYDELHQMEENDFRFANEEESADYVEDLCENMHFYPPREYITGSELYFEYNPEAIMRCLDYLTPDNVNIMISNGKFTEESLDKTEPWFKTRYTDTEIPRERADTWRDVPVRDDFHLPAPNQFLTDDFSLITLPADCSRYPVKLHCDDVSEIWYRPDPKFRLPECYMNFHLVSALGYETLENAAITAIYVGILKLLSAEELYPATAAGLDYTINEGDKGITIKINGFDKKLPLVLMIIAKYITDYSNVDKEELAKLFEVAKEYLLKMYYNTFIKAGKLAQDVRASILKHTHYTYVDLHAALRRVDFEMFHRFIRIFTDQLYIQCLVQGNMTADAVMGHVREFIERLNTKSLPFDAMPKTRIMRIPSGTHYCKVKNINVTDVNSVVMNYYQIGVESTKVSVLVDLLMMIMEEPLFNQLRTQEQLGYDVSCSVKDYSGILGYTVTILIQADKYTTEHVDQRIEEFFKALNSFLEKTTETELDNIKEALKKTKQCADIDLEEEVNRNWTEITTRQYKFDRLEREVLAIDDINLAELREWVARYTRNGDSFRKLSVHVVGSDPKNRVAAEGNDTEDEGKAEKEYSLTFTVYAQQHVEGNEAEGYNCITNIQEYKKDLSVYPPRELDALKAPKVEGSINNDAV